MRFILLLLLTVTTSVFAQRTQTFDADCLRIRDGACVDKTELGNLDGTTSNIQTQINGIETAFSNVDNTSDLNKPVSTATQAALDLKANTSDFSNVDNTSDLNKPVSTATQTALDLKANDANVVHKTGNEAISGNKNFQDKFEVTSLSFGSTPCPKMVQVDRDALVAPVQGDCVYNTTTNNLNVYDGSAWKSAGGGISNWETAQPYVIGDVVIESDKIYQALIAHTSGTFATDLAAANWIRLNDELTVNSIAGKTLEVPYKQATEVSTDKIRIETGNKNRLQDGGFENSIPSAYLTAISCTGTANPIPSAETTSPIEGKQSLIITVSGGASGGVCTIYQDATTLHALDGIVSMYLKSDTQAGVVFIKRVNGAESVRFDPNASNTYRDIVSNPVLFKIPGAMGTTSTGVGVEVTVAASQTIVVTMDEAKVGLEDVKQVVGVDTDPVAYTPIVVGGGTVTGSTANWWREGSVLHVEGSFTTGTVDANQASISLPFNLVAKTINTMARGRWVRNTTTASSVKGGPITVVNGFSVANFSIDDYTTGTSPLGLANGNAIWSNSQLVRYHFSVPVAEWSATTEVYSAAADFFSTDTNTLTFKATAITDSDPVGTFNTYSYTTSSNTKTICGTAPTQTIADMKTNGVKTFSRPYSTLSSCNEPSTIMVKIGKGMKVAKSTLFKDVSTSNPRVSMSTDSVINGASQYGAIADFYDETSGIYTFDAGWSISTVTSHSFLYSSDVGGATSGYLVINAQPKKTTAVADFAEVVKSQGASGQVDIQSVYFGSSADCSTTCTTGSCTICNQVGGKITSVSWSATGVYSINGIDGTKYNCQGNGWSTQSTVGVHSRPASGTTLASMRFFVGSTATNSGLVSVTCTGIP